MSVSFATTYISFAGPVPIAAATFHTTVLLLFAINGNNLPQSAVSGKCETWRHTFPCVVMQFKITSGARSSTRLYGSMP
jgi:hypothetical protein